MKSPTGRLKPSEPEMQNIPGSIAHRLEMARARGDLPTWDELLREQRPKT